MFNYQHTRAAEKKKEKDLLCKQHEKAGMATYFYQTKYPAGERKNLWETATSESPGGYNHPKRVRGYGMASAHTQQRLPG